MNGCPDWRDRIHGLADGELDSAHSARAEAHLAGCAACTALNSEILAQRAGLRAEDARAAAPERLRRRLEAALGEAGPAPSAVARETPASRRAEPKRRGERLRWGFGGAGLAVAACAAAALVVLPMLDTLALEREVLAGHVRSQITGHLIDVATSDRHVVKPWLGGRLDFSPPAPDLAAEGFAMAGGRLDYMAGRTVAAIVYRRGAHVIDLFVWPARGDPAPAGERSRDGYTLLHWRAGGMTFWAVSDVNPADLRAFRALIEARTPT